MTKSAAEAVRVIALRRNETYVKVLKVKDRMKDE